MRHDEHDDLRDVLRAEAERHQPDRAAMLNRIAARRSAPARGPMARVLAALSRPAAAATAVATLLVVGVAGAQVISSTSSPAPPATAPTTAPAAPVTTAPSPSRSAAPSSSRPRPTSPAAPPPSSASSKPPPRPTTTAPRPPDRPAPPAVHDRYLSATAVLDPASFANWAQSNLTLRTREPITELDVTIRIARTEGTASTGAWSTIPADLVTSSVATEDDRLVYRFVLKAGQTLGAGDYTFAAQYNHAAGDRDVRADSYRAKTDSAADKDAQVTGKFTK